MATYFLDTSAVVKRYVQETGTGWVQAETDPSASNTLFVSRVTQVETISAVTRRAKGASITALSAATSLADFQYDFAHQYLVVEVSVALLTHAASLARLYALRAYDAVQLAAALEVRSRSSSLVLMSSDGDLNAAAIAEGVPFEDPNAHP